MAAVSACVLSLTLCGSWGPGSRGRARLAAGREVREHMFAQVAELFHDLDAGMLPVSVLFPYLPIPPHRRRDRCAQIHALPHYPCFFTIHK